MTSYEFGDVTIILGSLERKADSFLKGSKKIAQEGFSAFKGRLKEQGICVLEELPGIVPITEYHLAKNIGFADEAKPEL